MLCSYSVDENSICDLGDLTFSLCLWSVNYVVQHLINIINGHSHMALMHKLLAEKRDYIKNIKM